MSRSPLQEDVATGPRSGSCGVSGAASGPGPREPPLAGPSVLLSRPCTLRVGRSCVRTPRARWESLD